MSGGRHAFGDGRGERDNIVANLVLDLLDASYAEPGMLAQERGSLFGYLAGLGEGFGASQLYLEPLAIFVFFAPDAAYFGPGITLDHSVRKDLGLLFRLGDHQPREESAACAIERSSGLVAHDFGVIVVFAQMAEHQSIDG